ncbi:MAG: hypothetical protein JKY33_06805 [Bacteroidia bacterium]|nr:hypothetical protein [Bacteroidia bacterium]
MSKTGLSAEAKVKEDTIIINESLSSMGGAGLIDSFKTAYQSATYDTIRINILFSMGGTYPI